MVAPQTFTGDDEVEIKVDEQAEQQGMGPHIDLGESVIQKHEPGREGRGARYGGEVRGRSSKERQVAQDLLLALRQGGFAVQGSPVRCFGAVVLDTEGEPTPIVQCSSQVLGVGLVRCIGPGHLDELMEGLSQVASLICKQCSQGLAQQLNGSSCLRRYVVTQLPAQPPPDAL